MNINSVIISIAIILSNIGARYIVVDLDQKGWDRVFGHPNMRYLYIFCMCYMGTHDVVTALMLSMVYGALVG